MFKLDKVLISSGWKRNELSTIDADYVMELETSKFYYKNGKDTSMVQGKEKFQNSKLWSGKRVLVEGDTIVVGDYLSNGGLLNEVEYTLKKEEYILEEYKKGKAESNRERREMTRLIKGKLVISREAVKTFIKGAAVASIVLSMSYVTYNYTISNVSPNKLYSYLKNNMGNYSLQKVVSNDNIGTITRKQLENIDYAISNDQVEELLSKTERTPGNLRFIEVLEGNLE